MDIGITREIKPGEGRVALLPGHVARLVSRDHRVLVERDAGRLAGQDDSAYQAAGGQICATAAEVFGGSELLVKVKEFLPREFDLLQAGHILFTNLHSAANRSQLDHLLALGLVAFAAEETHQHGTPNSPLAGEVGALEGIRLLLAPHGGTGRHFMAHFGEAAALALVLGLGGAGRGALRTLLKLGCRAVGFDPSPVACNEALLTWHDRDFQIAPLDHLAARLPQADLVINCVLWDKTRQDHLVSREMLARMQPGAVIVDVSCDPGGAIETSRPTHWAEPTYQVDGITHYCVDNLPGGVPITASAGYAEAIYPMVEALADHGPWQASMAMPWLARGLTCAEGVLLLEEAGRVQNRAWTPVNQFLANKKETRSE